MNEEITKKLLWQCRRGMKEMDLLFTHYLHNHYATADSIHRQAFVTLCNMQDPLIADYLFQRATPDSPAINDIITIMRAYSQARKQTP